jgi:hypothetical protein
MKTKTYVIGSTGQLKPLCRRPRIGTLAPLIATLMASLFLMQAQRTAAASYPSMAPLASYMLTKDQETALARSAAPPSISRDAEILVLGTAGYDTAIPGKNGFVCLVERSWGSSFDDEEYWNPRIRAPICFNPPAATSVLPTYLKQTRWLLSGSSKSQIEERTRRAVASKEIKAPAVGSMCYMMSKSQYLSDKAGGHWHPHLMYFLPHTDPKQWGANLDGSPMLASDGGVEPDTVFFAPVPLWSDGTPGPM